MNKYTNINYIEEIDKDLHLLIQSKCHRVPMYDTVEELNNPSGILYTEYEKIKREILGQDASYESHLDNLF